MPEWRNRLLSEADACLLWVERVNAPVSVGRGILTALTRLLPAGVVGGSPVGGGDGGAK